MVSLICCYNNLDLYQDLQNSLNNQSIEFEIIGIDNRCNIYESASSALNEGARQANGDILVFLHQDILFGKEYSLENFIKNISLNQDIIIGLFGAAHGTFRKIKENLYQVDTLDECCIAMSKKTWENFKFNEEICDGWHLYVVELCLRASRHNVLIATGNFNITHLSSGVVDEHYMKTLKRLLSIYKDKKWVSTTCKEMPTNTLFFNLYYAAWKIKKLIFGNSPVLYQIKKIRNKLRWQKNE